MENKLSAALADMEIELRKCTFDENCMVGLHHIFEQVHFTDFSPLFFQPLTTS